MVYTVNVTKEDIRNGKKGSCSMCPIALATRRVIRKLGHNNWRVNVGGNYGFVENSHGTDKGRLLNNSLISDFTSNFDSGYDVEPISLKLVIN